MSIAFHTLIFLENYRLCRLNLYGHCFMLYYCLKKKMFSLILCTYFSFFFAFRVYSTLRWKSTGCVNMPRNRIGIQSDFLCDSGVYRHLIRKESISKKGYIPFQWFISEVSIFFQMIDAKGSIKIYIKINWRQAMVTGFITNLGQHSNKLLIVFPRRSWKYLHTVWGNISLTT